MQATADMLQRLALEDFVASDQLPLTASQPTKVKSAFPHVTTASQYSCLADSFAFPQQPSALTQKRGWLDVIQVHPMTNDS